MNYEDVCKACMRLYASSASLRSHGYNAKHPLPVSGWMAKLAEFPPGTVFKVGRGQFGQAKLYALDARGRLYEAKASDAGAAVADENKTRSIPPKTEWHQADGFVGLPWVKYPKTPEIAQCVAAEFGKLASQLSVKSEEHAIVLSQRDFYLAYGARLQQLADNEAKVA